MLLSSTTTRLRKQNMSLVNPKLLVTAKRKKKKSPLSEFLSAVTTDMAKDKLRDDLSNAFVKKDIDKFSAYWRRLTDSMKARFEEKGDSEDGK